jgi:hypothetical protein
MITGNNTKMGLVEAHNILTSSTGDSKNLHMIAFQYFGTTKWTQLNRADLTQTVCIYEVCLKSSVNGIRKQTEQKIQTN